MRPLDAVLIRVKRLKQLVKLDVLKQCDRI